MTESIHEMLEALPQASLTTHVLGALDFIVPGEWQNITSFQQMIESVTGETDPAVVQAVGERAIQLWFDESTGFQRAATIYKLVDSGATVAGALSLANMAGSKWEVLSFLGDVTPKADTTQAVDAAVKFAAELTAFCMMNGLPGDSVGDFVSALGNAAKEDAMRFGAWIAVDCVLPLGPDFLSKVLETLQGAADGDLLGNGLFSKIADYLPGGLAEKKQLLTGTLEGAGSHIQGLVEGREITQQGILERVRGYVEIADDKLDLVSAALDLSLNTFEHTGIQTVARRVVTRAYGEI